MLGQALVAGYAAELRTVGVTGQPAPGTSTGVNFNSFGAYYTFPPSPILHLRGPVLNDAGQVAFRANLTGSGIDSTNNQGVWSEGSGSLALVTRTGDAAPGGGNFGTVSGVELFSPALNQHGQTAFYGALTDGRIGLWTEGSGTLALVARDGMPAPSTASGVSLNFAGLHPLQTDWPKLNNAGQTAFVATLSGDGVNSTNNWGLWSGNTGSLALVARAGDPAAGTPAGMNFGVSTFTPIPVWAAGLNDSGHTAFWANLTGEGIVDDQSYGVWSGATGSLELVARAGAQAPGTATGVNFGLIFGPIASNNAGQKAFEAFLTGNGVTTVNDEGLWSGGSGSLTLVARKGSQAAGTPSGVNYSFFRSYPVLNDAGQTAFLAFLAGSGVNSNNNLGIWSEGTGNLALVARTGSQAPGTSANVTFSDLHFPALNSAGQTAFRANLTGGGVNSTNDRGIWATDATGELRLLVRTGDFLEVAPGDSRTLSNVDFVSVTGNSDGRPSGFNNLGQLVYWASFSDGSEGVFVSNAVAHLPGDFNHDGTVDAADYVAWRKTGGTPADYQDWRANFGRTLSAGSGSAIPSAEALSATVPEPAAAVLLAAAAVTLGLFKIRLWRLFADR